MSKEEVKCLYCQTTNLLSDVNCKQCGMPLAKNHPNSATTRQKVFKPIFIGIAIFCFVMMFFLPR
ncbi:putative amidophosphoribosyltransferase [Thalassotalea piscium]|uniref:Putative amidophosphoribosyltransferase n=1 Tax=Thalassotalea piscium TaxID=1230533 RepID=A0A7X0NEX1_9GAMM|nr:putative amidophosphoribosyltransferase [Thalassotalea piscium]